MVNSEWNMLFPLRFGPDLNRPLSLALTLKESPARAEVECFIQERFAAIHHAEIQQFMPELLALHDRQGLLSATVGARMAASSPLFIEQYLQRPAESVLSQVAGRQVLRGEIVEVGNLAARNAGSARLIIVAMTWLLARRGLRWVVFTGAATLINSFQRLGLEPYLLCDADPALLGEDQYNWGSYYAQNPHVFMGDIRNGLTQLETSGVLARLGFPLSECEVSNAA
ncbi:thermostable hemolysin [Pseudomonas sp. NPDC078700]|uniref:thermostable hemolysin n=1 Tax=Pseudomonas sp. NPDC078700 TaxID=3364424 RepID=UPI0037C57625